METNKWISVKDHLPKHCEVVMIPCNDNPLGMIMAQFMEHGISKGMEDEKNYFCKADEYGFNDKHPYFEIKAWLPLPIPAKELLPIKNRQIEYLDMTDSDTAPKNNDIGDKFQITIGDTAIKQKQWYID